MIIINANPECIRPINTSTGPLNLCRKISRSDSVSAISLGLVILDGEASAIALPEPVPPPSSRKQRPLR